jgi:UDP-N-acetylmuramyl pentapeptide phosphotransferase/UDP-N-acetylglucosamine-1-phosphate transferase
MTWLVVLLVWTVCAALVAPFIGRVLAHGGVVERRSPRPVHHRPLPTPRRHLVLH